VNAATGIAFGVAFVFAVGNWIAKARSTRALEYVCKPATMVALIAAAAFLDPVADAHTRRAWFVAALIFSLAGDVLLMLPQDLFVGGLAAFLVGHVCYVVGFWSDRPATAALAVSALIVGVAIVPLARTILGAIARRGEPRSLLGAVGCYIAVISAMLVTALATGNPLAGAGAVAFVASDSMIAWDRFVRGFAWAPIAIMVTYHLGQAGLVASLLH